MGWGLGCDGLQTTTAPAVVNVSGVQSETGRHVGQEQVERTWPSSGARGAVLESWPDASGAPKLNALLMNVNGTNIGFKVANTPLMSHVTFKLV